MSDFLKNEAALNFPQGEFPAISLICSPPFCRIDNFLTEKLNAHYCNRNGNCEFSLSTSAQISIAFTDGVTFFFGLIIANVQVDFIYSQPDSSIDWWTERQGFLLGIRWRCSRLFSHWCEFICSLNRAISKQEICHISRKVFHYRYRFANSTY